jgi:hypothetical protein
MSRIRVTFYFRSGDVQSEHDYDTAEQAFERMQRTGMEAMARPVNTTCGAYYWNPSKEHNLEGFKAKLALCCNSPLEYSENLIRAGICKGNKGRL